MLSKALATLSLLFDPALAAPQAAKWRFDLLKNNSGIVALESIVVSPSLAIFFDRATGDQPLKTSDGKGAHGALWDISAGTVRPLDVKTDSFCASGALLSNGSMVSVGGHPGATTSPVDIAEAGGPNALRIFEPCASPSGEGCTLFEDVNTLHLLAPRWYPSSVRIFDGSLMIVGGMHTRTIFYNTEPENSFEFFPRKEQTVRPSAFLERSLPANLFPRAFALPDGKVFLVANNQSIIYDIEANTERILPDIPNGVRVTNPLDGSAILLPLSPPDYTPEVLVCGGTVLDTNIPVEQLSSQHPATAQCSRITLTEAGIARGWEVEQMLEPRIMPELLHVPNGQILITNGGRTGFVGFSAVRDPVGNSNADHPAFTPALYTPSAPLGRRFSNTGMPTTDIARLYHSSVTLTDAGNFLVAGSNPNGNFTAPLPGVKFPSELRVEMLNPPFMFVPRPVVGSAPKNLAFGQKFTVPVSVPSGLNADKVQVALMDLGFSSHAFHSSARLVFMEAELSRDRRTLTFTTPPNGRVFPPGPAIIFLTVDDVTAEGVRVMMGSGASPPTLE